MAVVAFDSFPGGIHIQPPCLHDESYLVEWGRGGKVVHQAHVQLRLVGGAVVVCSTVVTGISRYEVGVTAGDDGSLFLVASLADHLDIQFLADAFLQGDADALLGDVALAFLQSLGGQVFQHFELVGAFADQRT